jgi:hypothetical protein
MKTATLTRILVAAHVPMAALVLYFCGCAGSMPRTACASNPSYTTRAEVDACLAALDAGPPQAVVVVAKDGGT